jgi:hypothetical protein
MAVTVEVKSHDPTVKEQREALACSVRDEFATDLPDLKLLTFFDDCDWAELKWGLGKENRGFYTPIDKNTFRGYANLPQGLAEKVYDTNFWVPNGKRSFDHLIYLHGATCSYKVGLVMTFAHELQHFVQYGSKRKLWAASKLIRELSCQFPKIQEKEHLNWPDIPHEREARIVAKRVGVNLLGAEEVQRYIAGRICENVSIEDVEDWRFSQGVDPSDRYDLSNGIRGIFQRLKPYRNELEQVLQQMNSKFPGDYGDVDLSTHFGAP